MQTVKTQSKQTILSLNQILNMSDKEIEQDIYQGIHKSRIIRTFKDKFTNGVLTKHDLRYIGVLANTVYIEDEKRSYTKLHIEKLDIKLLRAYFITRQGGEV